MVHQNKIGVDGGDSSGDLLQFAFADERGRIRTVTMLNKFAGNFRTCGRYKLAKFRQRLFNIEMRDTSGLRSHCRSAARYAPP